MPAQSTMRLDAKRVIISWGYSEQVPGNPVLEAYVGRTELQRRLQWLGTRHQRLPDGCPCYMAFSSVNGWYTPGALVPRAGAADL